MKITIGVVSDTHSRPLPKQLLRDLKEVDFIIHAGDFCDFEDLDRLEKLREVRAVYGNMDTPAIRKKFPGRQIIECGPWRIGVFHGEGARATILKRVQEEFKKDKVHVVIFGHSHVAMNEKIGGTLYFNPGSPNDPMARASYGLLDVDEKGVQGRIILVND